MSSAYNWKNLSLVKSPLLDKVDDSTVKESKDVEKSQPEYDHKDSVTEKVCFRRLPHSTNVELFYDLFFVANLTAFTAVHEVNDAPSLRQYVAFFCILWFTWYQVSLYEVRFGMDSVFERIGKAVQFLVMMVFAICGPRFDVAGSNEPSYEYLRALTLALMVSRLVLSAEYIQVALFARSGQQGLVPPLLVHALLYGICAVVYLGLYWALNENSPQAYIAWFILAVFEFVVLTASSIIWRVVSFKGTHLVERMSLLTLIILGEGAISTARAVQTVAQSDGVLTFSGSVAAQIVCAVLNLYFMFMIYFDWINEELFGAIRVQIWSLLHFPLHVTVALAVEGAAQCITWNAGIVRAAELSSYANDWGDRLFHAGENVTADLFREAAISFNDTATVLFSQQLAISTEFYATADTFSYWYQKDHAVVPAILDGTRDSEAARNAIWWVSGVMYTTIFKIAGFNSPVTDEDKNALLSDISTPLDFSASSDIDYEEKANEYIDQSWEVFILTFLYFFIATGVFLVLCATLAWLNGGRQAKSVWERLLFMRMIALALSLLTTIATSATYLENFVSSSWLLPTVTLCLFTIVVLDSIALPNMRFWRKEKRADHPG